MKPTNNLYRLGIKALFEAVVLNEANRSGTTRLTGPGTSTDTGGAGLHHVTQHAADRVVPKNVTRFKGDPTSLAAAKAQKKANTAQDAMNAATTPSIAPPRNLPAPTNEPYVPMAKRKAETEGGRPTDPDNIKIGKSEHALTRGEARAKLMAMRNKK